MKALLVLAAMGMAFAGETIKLRNTHYYVVLEREYANFPKDDKLLDLQGNVIAEVSHQFKKAADIEGTGRLLDGRVVNYAGRVDGQIRWVITSARYGFGVGSCQLIPFRTVAVDPKVIPLGSILFIKETVGMKLTGSRKHNGYWKAEDVGGAIKSDRIDLFVGDGNRGDILRAAGITNLMPLTVEIVAPPLEDSCVHARSHLLDDEEEL